jgi:dienelactone hydrolase
MRKLTLATLALGLCALPLGQAGAGAQTAPAVEKTAPASVKVRENGLVATWYPPASGRKGPVLLVLGGSEGGEAMVGLMGRAFAEQGYGVLALAWFQAEGLPPHLQDVPLEYFAKAIDWIEAQPLADAKRIGIYGVSKGGETALLIASRHPEIKAVVAAVPSSVVWQGINFTDYMSVKSSFSAGGRPVAYVPYDQSAPFTSVLDLYQRSLKHIGKHPEAAIPVERINGPVLLLSGKADALWPSTEMSEQVIARLDARGFKHKHQHLAYDDAGHSGVVVPLGGGAAAAPGGFNMGGTPEGNAKARADAWTRTLAFLAEALGGPSR